MPGEIPLTWKKKTKPEKYTPPVKDVEEIITVPITFKKDTIKRF